MYMYLYYSSDTAESLIHTLWLMFTLGFGLRGRQEHVNMLWGDIELLTDTNGRRYLEFTERATKTRNGLNGQVRTDKQIIFEMKGTVHAIKIFKNTNHN